MNIKDLFTLTFGNIRMIFTRKFWIAFIICGAFFLITIKFESHYRIQGTKDETYKDTWLRPSNFINGVGLYIRDGWYFLARHSVAVCNFLGSFLPEAEDCLTILDALVHFLWYSIFSYPWGFIKYSCEYATKHYIIVGTFIAIGIISFLCYIFRKYLKRFFMYISTFRCVQFIWKILKKIPNCVKYFKNLVIIAENSGIPTTGVQNSRRPDICCCCTFCTIGIMGLFLLSVIYDFSYNYNRK